MNNDQIKEMLIQLEKPLKDFQVVLSGKKSKKVHGLYKPESHEIIIHNKNFDNDDQVIHTAIHEYAHHIQFTTSAQPVSPRCHTTLFWNILHNLLNKAETTGIYKNPFKTDKEFIALTKKIKEKYLSVNGELMLEFGKVLLQAQELCEKNMLSFDDYMDRELSLHRTSAKTIMKCSSMDIGPEIGFDNMKIVASIKDPEMAKEAEEAFIQGQSPDMVKTQFKAKPRPDSQLDFLIAEKDRVKFSIERLKIKLNQLEDNIAKIKKEGSGA